MSDTVNGKILSLSCGTLALGMAECAMMAILPEAAAGLGVSIPTAGQYISAYAAGVCVGAPLLAMTTGHWPLRRILLLLAWMMMLGNLATAFSTGHGTMLGMRFLAGLPHGAFFGTGSIVAERLAARGKAGQTVAVMLMGISAANVIGVPLAVMLVHWFCWQAAFLLTALWGLATLILVAYYVPILPALPHRGVRGQFAFLRRPAPWFLLGVTLLANLAYFCFYSYVKPYLTQVAGFGVGSVSVILLLAGVAMCTGNWLCGKGCDRFTPTRTAMAALLLLLAGLSTAFLAGRTPWAAVLATCTVSGCIFGVGLCWQVMILRHARGGEMIGVAAIQMAFNGGNALGAWCGGIPLAKGFPPQYAALPGLCFALIAVFLLSLLLWREEADSLTCRGQAG